MARSKGDKNVNIMKAFFRREVALEPKELTIGEIGEGMGVGRSSGTYSTYFNRVKSLSRKNVQNPSIYIGKNIVVNDTQIFDIDEVENGVFDIKKGETPIVLVVLYNVINETQVRIEWKDLDGKVLSNSFYNIPRASNKGYTWWDMYGAYFYAPEKLGVGDHYADIKLIESNPVVGDKASSPGISSYKIDFSIK